MLELLGRNARCQVTRSTVSTTTIQESTKSLVTARKTSTKTDVSKRDQFLRKARSDVGDVPGNKTICSKRQQQRLLTSFAVCDWIASPICSKKAWNWSAQDRRLSVATLRKTRPHDLRVKLSWRRATGDVQLHRMMQSTWYWKRLLVGVSTVLADVIGQVTHPTITAKCCNGLNSQPVCYEHVASQNVIYNLKLIISSIVELFEPRCFNTLDFKSV